MSTSLFTSLSKSCSSSFKKNIPLVLAGLLLTTACAEPPKTETTQPATTPSTSVSTATPKPETTSNKSQINVNTAPIAELDKLELPGTKPSLSERIQGARPYKSIDDLVTKKAISAEELALIKNLVKVDK